MKVRVSTPMHDHLGEPPLLEATGPFDVEIECNGTIYVLSDRVGKLTLRDRDGRQMQIAPECSNVIAISSVPWM